MAENMTMASNSDFKRWVSQLKQDIRSAQIRAAIKVNTELLRLYWRMGADICEKQKSASWGDGWLKELSRELMDCLIETCNTSDSGISFIIKKIQLCNKLLHN